MKALQLLPSFPTCLPSEETINEYNVIHKSYCYSGKEYSQFAMI